MKTRMRLPMLAGIFSLATVAMPATAGLAVDIDNDHAVGDGTAGANNATTPETVGYTFTLTGTVKVTSLGVLDFVKNDQTGQGAASGLLTDHLVRIWNSDGSQVLASGTVGAGTCSNAVATASSVDESSWCFVDITDVTLAAGTYVIGAVYTSYNGRGGDIYRNGLPSSDLTRTSGMSLGDARNSSIDGFPAVYAAANQGYFGPNFQVADAGTVPEPGSLALLGAALAGLTLTRRRKQ